MILKTLKTLDSLIAMYESDPDCTVVFDYNNDRGTIMITDCLKGRGYGGHIIPAMKKFFGKEIEVKPIKGAFYQYFGEDHIWKEEWFENNDFLKDAFEI